MYTYCMCQMERSSLGKAVMFFSSEQNFRKWKKFNFLEKWSHGRDRFFNFLKARWKAREKMLQSYKKKVCDVYRHVSHVIDVQFWSWLSYSNDYLCIKARLVCNIISRTDKSLLTVSKSVSNNSDRVYWRRVMSFVSTWRYLIKLFYHAVSLTACGENILP